MHRTNLPRNFLFCKNHSRPRHVMIHCRPSYLLLRTLLIKHRDRNLARPNRNDFYMLWPNCVIFAFIKIRIQKTSYPNLFTQINCYDSGIHAYRHGSFFWEAVPYLFTESMLALFCDCLGLCGKKVIQYEKIVRILQENLGEIRLSSSLNPGSWFLDRDAQLLGRAWL
jgi:hypothetical protein